jgi:hypothetical protein
MGKHRRKLILTLICIAAVLLMAAPVLYGASGAMPEGSQWAPTAIPPPADGPALVRGQDAAGNWGAFSAVFLYVTASGPTPTPTATPTAPPAARILFLHHSVGRITYAYNVADPFDGYVDSDCSDGDCDGLAQWFRDYSQTNGVNYEIYEVEWPWGHGQNDPEVYRAETGERSDQSGDRECLLAG